MLLEKKNAIVTGGSRGIGGEIVRAFLRNGATVHYIDLEQGDDMKEYREIAVAHGCEVFFEQSDVADEEKIGASLDRIIKQCETIDVLVNNAGITRDGLIFRMSSENWRKVIDINLTSAFLTSRVIARRMTNSRSGSIINVASIVGVIGNAGQANYCASKAGVIGLTKSLAREVASRNVRVNAVAPGFIGTRMTETLNETQKNALQAQIPLGRIGDAEEVAKVILFLASDLSSYLTGQVIHVTGGLGM